MISFREFLTKQGIHNVDDLILFIENLPDNPEGMDHMAWINRYGDQIDKAFEIFINNNLG